MNSLALTAQDRARLIGSGLMTGPAVPKAKTPTAKRRSGYKHLWGTVRCHDGFYRMKSWVRKFGTPADKELL